MEEVRDVSLHFRHGDLLIEQIDQIPQDVKLVSSNIILEGTLTGHAHRLNGGQIFGKEGTVYLSVPESGTLTHEEHNTINLPAGNYIVIRQREFDPFEEAVRYVQD